MQELIALTLLRSLGLMVLKTIFSNILIISSRSYVFAEETCARR